MKATGFVYYSILITLIFSRDLAADESRFYRVAPVEIASLQGVDRNGILIWSNAIAGGNFEIQASGSLTETNWIPVIRGAITNSLMSRKVFDISVPEGLSFIPGGTFRMGDSQNDPKVFTLANPVHTVTVSPFFMERTEVSNMKMSQVLQWAYTRNLVTVMSNGVFNAEGTPYLLLALNRYNSEISFKGGVFTVKAGRQTFPCVYLSWYGGAAYCQYLSAMEGRELCYDFANWSCDFTRNGYRLPTEAEWEFAARGGHEGLRFPWADTNVITHSRANYDSDTNNWFDVSPTRGFHPDFVNNRPRTSPVGMFPPNDFGLYDMAGNCWEWVWDWHGRYSSAAQVDPKGPVSGVNRLFRGGSWFTTAERVTCAMRYQYDPAQVFDDFGVRAVLPHAAPRN